MVGRKLSWTTVNTLDLVEPLTGVLSMNKRIAESFKALLRPPQFEPVDIQNALFTFITSLPDYIPRVRQDKTFELFKSVRTLLKSKQCVQLYGLLIHFCYWNIVHPTVRHTIQTLRAAQQEAAEATFRDVDLSAQGMLQLRQRSSTSVGALAQGRPGTGAPRTPLAVEQMFADEVFGPGGEGAGPQVMTLDGEGNSSAMQQFGADQEWFASEGPPHSRSASPVGQFSSPPGSRPGSRAASPALREMSSLFEQAQGSRKVGFGVLASTESAPGSRGIRSRKGSRVGSPNRPLVGDVSCLAGDGGGAEDRHDGSPSISPLRTRAFSSISGVGGSDGFVPDGGSINMLQEREGEWGHGQGLEKGLGQGGSLGGGSAETEASLSAAEKEQLFMQLEVCLLDLFSQVTRVHCIRKAPVMC